ncbi:ATP-dependent DNA helicase [Schizosaccharomyces japonicus yFS275]|uniref:DNA 3'-5' helicase n=1 Tax=Schizosaccharomyces japonicus (strain yFS275 / FY16936) TaxID=402676 RepID=B6K8G0_SCHJY|nr:ATP-dependent DNA helicase [Schizosaccharomyces japonicus yFS275]EEB05003.2 ATP-dependent DNA helicase [Schizosaccharomyces japonicus yFS275]
MYRMKNLMQVSCSFLLLTATLPLKMERQLCSELCIVPYPIRCSTMRPNIEYRVQRLVKRDFLNVLISYCEQAQKITEQGWRGLVFFQSKKVLHSCYEAVQKDTSFKYKVGIYYSDLEETEKKENMARFMASEDSLDIMFCTKAFGMGVDYAHVRFSIHYGSPGTIFDYAQESGRCGRDGKHATSLLLHYPFSGFESEMHMEENMKNLLRDNNLCVREAISGELDNAAESCCSYPNCVPCFRCSDDVNNETYLPTQHVGDIQMFNRTPSAMSTLIIEDDSSFFSAYDASSPLKNKSRVPHQDIDIFSPTIEGNPKISEGNTDAATTQTQISCEISSSSQERKRKIGSDDSASMNVPSSDFSSPTKRVQRNINNNTEVVDRVRSLHMGRLMFIKHCGKQRNVTNKEDFSPRFLPRQLSLLLLRYLVRIRPAEQLFCELLYNEDSKVEDLKTSVFLKNGSTLPINEAYRKLYQNTSKKSLERFLEGPQQAQLSTYDAQDRSLSQFMVALMLVCLQWTDVLPNAYTASINWQSLLGIEEEQEATGQTTTEPQAPSVVEHSLPLAQEHSCITEPTVTEVLKPIVTRGPRRMTAWRAYDFYYKKKIPALEIQSKDGLFLQLWDVYWVATIHKGFSEELLVFTRTAGALLRVEPRLFEAHCSSASCAMEGLSLNNFKGEKATIYRS